MTTHRHNIPAIRTRKVNGRPVWTATIHEADGIFQGVVTDVHGNTYASGSNARDLRTERRVLREMLDRA